MTESRFGVVDPSVRGGSGFRPAPKGRWKVFARSVGCPFLQLSRDVSCRQKGLFGRARGSGSKKTRNRLKGVGTKSISKGRLLREVRPKENVLVRRRAGGNRL